MNLARAQKNRVLSGAVFRLLKEFSLSIPFGTPRQ